MKCKLFKKGYGCVYTGYEYKLNTQKHCPPNTTGNCNLKTRKPKPKTITVKGWVAVHSDGTVWADNVNKHREIKCTITYTLPAKEKK